jgi:predicted HTH domain antitoxin
MSQVVQIEVPDEVALAMQKEPADVAKEMRLAAAAKWYEMGLLSQEKAAETAGLNRAAFLNELARFGVSPFQETTAEILESVNTAER